ncbi:hypothetical protein [Mechercharimyces sp. CAU 1602]|uniref:hypothetical protein n=1 Tax=Mechercharimyces sp. CAU 1602 TaxID=2973933 RepID=UPI0021610FC0|nr:hypothetical protein [Mechercharimyces sp. CAU 1602]MCS1352448.1 hypothetical protein [Mechercharimyces sp. CAU 1602]
MKEVKHMKKTYLEFKPTTPFPDPPSRIERVLQQYVHEGESYSIMPTRVDINGSIYYCVGIIRGKLEAYRAASGYLMVRDDGRDVFVPTREESVKPFYMHRESDSILATLYSIGYRWSQRSMWVCKSLLFILDHAKRLSKGTFPPEVELAYQRFRSIATVILERQQNIIKSVDEAQELFAKFTTEHVIDEELYKMIWACFMRTMNSVYDQHEIQISTLDDRKQFLRYLFRQLRPWRIRLIGVYLILCWNHIDLMPSGSNMSDHKDVEEFLSQDDPKLKNMKSLDKLLRNPVI